MDFICIFLSILSIRVELQVRCRLTSDRKVCADFCAPTCSRYSYTYNANLQNTHTKKRDSKVSFLVSRNQKLHTWFKDEKKPRHESAKFSPLFQTPYEGNKRPTRSELEIRITLNMTNTSTSSSNFPYICTTRNNPEVLIFFPHHDQQTSQRHKCMEPITAQSKKSSNDTTASTLNAAIRRAVPRELV